MAVIEEAAELEDNQIWVWGRKSVKAKACESGARSHIVVGKMGWHCNLDRHAWNERWYERWLEQSLDWSNKPQTPILHQQLPQTRQKRKTGL